MPKPKPTTKNGKPGYRVGDKVYTYRRGDRQSRKAARRRAERASQKK